MSQIYIVFELLKMSFFYCQGFYQLFTAQFEDRVVTMLQQPRSIGFCPSCSNRNSMMMVMMVVVVVGTVVVLMEVVVMMMIIKTLFQERNLPEKFSLSYSPERINMKQTYATITSTTTTT